MSGPRPRRAAWALAVAAAACLTASLPAQEGAGPERTVPWDGTEAFQQILSFNNLTPLKSVSELRDHRPSEVLVVVFGDPAPLADVAGEYDRPGGRFAWLGSGLQQFLNRGGALLVATDRPTGDELAELGVSVRGGAPPWNGDFYQGREECPLLKAEQALPAGHPLFRGVAHGVAANRPSYFRAQPQAIWRCLVPVAGTWFPPGLQVFGPDGVRPPELNGVLLAFEQPPPNIPGRDRPPGRGLVLSGHGAFLNVMMVQPGADNFRFASNAVRWLADDGRRKYVLFLYEGQPIGTLDAPAPARPAVDIPIPSEEAINQILVAFQDRGGFDVLTEWAVRGTLGSFSRLRRLLLLILGAVLLLWVLRAAVLGRRRRERYLPVVDRIIEKTVGTEPLPARRQAAMLRGGSLGEPGRALARQWFDVHAGPGAAAAAPPRVAAAGWWGRRRAQRDVNRLWALAYGPAGRKLSRRQFRAAVGAVRRLTLALAQGRVRLAAGAGAPAISYATGG